LRSMFALPNCALATNARYMSRGDYVPGVGPHSRSFWRVAFKSCHGGYSEERRVSFYLYTVQTRLCHQTVREHRREQWAWAYGAENAGTKAKNVEKVDTGRKRDERSPAKA
jgi:hypothetical protein